MRRTRHFFVAVLAPLLTASCATHGAQTRGAHAQSPSEPPSNAACDCSTGTRLPACVAPTTCCCGPAYIRGGCPPGVVCGSCVTTCGVRPNE